jgi:hypothetical protein
MDHWPTLCLNSLRWAKAQGAVCGPAHSGWGLAVETKELPNYIVPPFDGIGANEYIVDVTHLVKGPEGDLIPAVDFVATVDTPYVWYVRTVQYRYMTAHSLTHSRGMPTTHSGRGCMVQIIAGLVTLSHSIADVFREFAGS